MHHNKEYYDCQAHRSFGNHPIAFTLCPHSLKYWNKLRVECCYKTLLKVLLFRKSKLTCSITCLIHSFIQCLLFHGFIGKTTINDISIKINGTSIIPLEYKYDRLDHGVRFLFANRIVQKSMRKIFALEKKSSTTASRVKAMTQNFVCNLILVLLNGLISDNYSSRAIVYNRCFLQTRPTIRQNTQPRRLPCFCHCLYWNSGLVIIGSILFLLVCKPS